MIALDYRCYSQKICDFSGKLIQRMEPRLEIRRIGKKINDANLSSLEELHIKKEELNKLKYSIIFNNNFEEEKDESYKTRRYYSCLHNNREKITIKTDHHDEDLINLKNIELCKKCAKKVLDKIEEIDKNEKSVEYYSKHGVSLNNFREDTIFNKVIEDCYSIKLGAKQRRCLSLNDLDVLIKKLDPKENIKGGTSFKIKECSSSPTDELEGVSCISCGNPTNIKKPTYDDKIYIHNYCKRKLLEKIREMVEENSNIVVSEKLNLWKNF